MHYDESWRRDEPYQEPEPEACCCGPGETCEACRPRIVTEDGSDQAGTVPAAEPF